MALGFASNLAAQVLASKASAGVDIDPAFHVHRQLIVSRGGSDESRSVNTPLPGSSKKRYLRLKDFSVPNCFDNVRSTNNVLRVTISSTDYSVTLTTGIYDTDELADHLQTQLRNQLTAAGVGAPAVATTVVVFDDLLLRFDVSTEADLQLLWADPLTTCGELLGGGNEITQNVNTTSAMADPVVNRTRLEYVPQVKNQRVSVVLNGLASPGRTVHTTETAAKGLVLRLSDYDKGEIVTHDRDKVDNLLPLLEIPRDKITTMGFRFLLPDNTYSDNNGAYSWLMFDVVEVSDESEARKRARVGA